MASIYKRKDHYQIRVYHGYDNKGHQIVKTTTWKPDPTKSERQNQKDLERAAFEFEEKVCSGKYLDGDKLSFQDFAERWMKKYAPQHLEKNTIRNYQHLLEAHIYPVIGWMNLSEIQPAILNDLYLSLTKHRKDGKSGGYSQKTIRDVHNVISKIYNTAVQWNVCEENPCKRVDPPKVQRMCDKIKYFTPQQVVTFLKLLDEEGIYGAPRHGDSESRELMITEFSAKGKIPLQFKVFFYLALDTGCRRGELIALQWSDIDIVHRTILITKNAIRGENKKPASGVKGPKTEAGYRIIAISKVSAELLSDYHKKQAEYAAALGNKWHGDGNVFIQWDGTRMFLDTPYRVFRKIIKKYNETCDKEEDKLPLIPLHGLRHTSATLLIANHVDVKTVSERLGHSHTSITMDVYAHSLQEADRTAANIFDNMLSPKQ
jgi:integrase